MEKSSRSAENFYNSYDFLKATVSDAVSLCEKNNSPRFSGFLTEGERLYIEKLLKGKPIEASFTEENYDEPSYESFGESSDGGVVFQISGCKYAFFGGHSNAARTIFGVFPDYYNSQRIFEFFDINQQVFPVTAFTFYYRRQKKLTHRDFLGSLMALGIERNQVGDILCGEGFSVLFLSNKISSFIKTQLEQVGSEGVLIKEGVFDELPEAYEVKPISGTVASLRLDSVVKLAVSGSREDSSKFISAGLVSVNHRLCESGSHKVSQGDIISVRGKGRFKIFSVGNLTKKGRVFLEIHKYI